MCDSLDTEYAGTWYEQKSYPTVWYMSSTSCLSSSITIVDDGSIQMTRSGVDGSGKDCIVLGIACIPDKKKPLLKVKSMVTNGTAWRNERQDYQTSLQDHAYLRDQQRTSHTYIE
ncbi:uncharacterized protein LOC132559725 isoform X2 [Ylistrum balloti]|uniref:uncharacterized protein LOC132559725 isoform X2 n=1 Tax=Ylistrum balloti TaxID=509963 RepID=UPI002905B731|nr:uncharacterized protein LOC132559725 isoform X2 [Ylistrum balloti]